MQEYHNRPCSHSRHSQSTTALARHHQDCDTHFHVNQEHLWKHVVIILPQKSRTPLTCFVNSQILKNVNTIEPEVTTRCGLGGVNLTIVSSSQWSVFTLFCWFTITDTDIINCNVNRHLFLCCPGSEGQAIEARRQRQLRVLPPFCPAMSCGHPQPFGF